MQKLITNLVKREMTLEEKVKADLEKYFGSLSIDYVLAHPSGELQDFALSAMEKIFNKYSKEYILAGVEFGDAVNKAKKPLEIASDGSR